MKKIIFLTDLIGDLNSEYVIIAKKLFGNSFHFKSLSSKELANINYTLVNKEDIHDAFINGGLNTSVSTLNQVINEKTTIIGCSIGGVIGWKTALINKNIDHLICISSTRLRKEQVKPRCKIDLYYGQNDSYIPNENWFNSMGLQNNLIEGKGHDIYKDVYLLDLIKSNVKIN